jgi:eukaryotic-like serine/threonine-protein kinase
MARESREGTFGLCSQRMTFAPLDTDRLIGDRYVLESLIAKGGMGEVWRARHKALKSLVAIKFLHHASAFSQSTRKRFLTEAQVTANLKTRHAVQVFDFGVTDDGLPYLVMEYLEGETLELRIAREGRLSVETTYMALRQAARALDRAHALGIVHRDFKPENLILIADEEGGEHVKVVDFGIAKILGELELALDRSGASTSGDAPNSGTFSAVGTPYYMAPEQIEDTSLLGPAADIWAFGVVAYECLTGRKPFDDESIPHLLRRILQGTPLPEPPSSLAPLPALFDDWFQVACARDPNDRFADAQTAASALGIALGVPTGPLTTTTRHSTPSVGSITPKRVVSPMAATLDARKSARPPAPSPSSDVLGPTPLLKTEAHLAPHSADVTPQLADPTGSASRPPQLLTDAPIERPPRLSLTARAGRMPAFAALALSVMAIVATTTISARRRTGTSPRDLHAAAAANLVNGAASAAPSAPDRGTTSPTDREATSPTDRAPAASGTSPFATAPSAASSAAASPPGGGAIEGRRPATAPPRSAAKSATAKHAGHAPSAPPVFRLPPLGI